MELLETVTKLFGLLIFYCFFFLLGGTFLCFMLIVAAAYCISSLFGMTNQGESYTPEDPVRDVSYDLYAHDTIVLYKKEEYPATIMYSVISGPSEFDIVSITNAQEDFTDILPPEEISRLLVELEYSHVG